MFHWVNIEVSQKIYSFLILIPLRWNCFISESSIVTNSQTDEASDNSDKESDESDNGSAKVADDDNDQGFEKEGGNDKQSENSGEEDDYSKVSDLDMVAEIELSDEKEEHFGEIFRENNRKLQQSNREDAEVYLGQNDNGENINPQDLENWKQRFEEEHKEKLRELEIQKKMLEDLQEKMIITTEKHAEQRLLLEDKQEKLYREQQEFLDKQLKQQNDVHNIFKVKINFIFLQILSW